MYTSTFLQMVSCVTNCGCKMEMRQTELIANIHFDSFYKTYLGIITRVLAHMWVQLVENDYLCSLGP